MILSIFARYIQICAVRLVYLIVNIAKCNPRPRRRYTLDHEMDALNLWSPWAAKTKAAKGMAPLTERELENIKNKSWTVERRA